MKNRITNIYEGIYKKYGLNEFFYFLMEKYHISFFNLDMKSVELSFPYNDIVIYEGSSKRRFIIHPTTDYVLFTKEYLEYKELLWMDLEGNVFRESIVFDIGDNKILVGEGFNDENIQSRRIVKTTKDDELFLNGDFEYNYSVINEGLVQEDYSYIRHTQDREDVVKKISLLEGGRYFELSSTKRNIPIANPEVVKIEIASSTNAPTINFQGRIRDRNSLLKSSLNEKCANVLIAISKNAKTKMEYSRYDFLINNGFLKIRSYIFNEGILSNLKEDVIACTHKDTLFSTDIDIIIEYVTRNITDNCRNMIIGKLVELKRLLIIEETKEKSTLDMFDYRMKHFERLEDFLQNFKNNLSYYKMSILEKKEESNDKKRYLKK